MKKIIYSIAIIALFSTLISCTADEIEPEKNPQTTATDLGSDIVPPPTPPTNPK
jgi:hypothetical protein